MMIPTSKLRQEIASIQRENAAISEYLARVRGDLSLMEGKILMEEADGAAFACHLNVKTLEINRLRREVRRYAKNVGSRARSRV